MNRCTVVYREWRVDANKNTKRNATVSIDTIDATGLAADDRGCRLFIIVDNGTDDPVAFRVTSSMGVTLRDALIDVLGHPARGS